MTSNFSNNCLQTDHFTVSQWVKFIYKVDCAFKQLGKLLNNDVMALEASDISDIATMQGTIWLYRLHLPERPIHLTRRGWGL
jgi:hypothetical protein